MSSQLLVTAIGEDKPGIVARITEVLFKHGANLEESRMAILGGEFAAIMLVTGQAGKMDAMLDGLAQLEREGISVSTKKTSPVISELYKDHACCEIFLRGADHEGIVHRLSTKLRDMKVNIQSMHTEVVGAPETGTPLFCMDALVQVPPSTTLESLQKELDKISSSESVDIEMQTHSHQSHKSKAAVKK